MTAQEARIYLSLRGVSQEFYENIIQFFESDDVIVKSVALDNAISFAKTHEETIFATNQFGPFDKFKAKKKELQLA